MKFGRLTSVDAVDFRLPGIEEALCDWAEAEPVEEADLELYVGAPVWSHKSFLGKIYPPKLKPSEFLQHYARNFNCIELNSTFYGTPPEERVKSWCEQVGEGFRFCPKVPRDITHTTGPLPRAELARFISTMQGFGTHLGECFFQFSPELGPRQWRRLKELLEQLPPGFEAAIELRHPDWFATDKALRWLQQLGVEHGVDIVCSDTAGRRDAVHLCLPRPAAFVRFSGDALVPSDFQRLDVWGQRLGELRERGLKRCYFFLHQEEEGNCVELAEHLATLMPEARLPTIERVRVAEQLALF